MTGSELLTYVKQVFKRADKDTELYEAMTDTIRDIKQSIFVDDDATVSADLVSSLSEGDFKIDVPSDFQNLAVDNVLVRETSGDDTYRPLIKKDKNWYDNYYHSVYSSTVANRNTGVPAHFVFFGNQIYVGPAVDKTTYEFKINYTTNQSSEITSSTSPVPFSEEYREVLRYGVLQRIFELLENFPEAERWEIKYLQGRSKIEDNYMKDSDVSSCIEYNSV